MIARDRRPRAPDGIEASPVAIVASAESIEGPL
jgi:hypothetical protein